MTFILRTLLIGLLLLPPVYTLEFSEIFSNPVGSDNYKEFVELTGNEDLEGCQIQDEKSTDKLKHLQKGNDIILIVEDNSTWLPIEKITIYTAGSAIGNGLDNTHDMLKIICEEKILAESSYNTTSVEGYREGFSLHWKHEWKADYPSPGTTAEVLIKNTIEPAIISNMTFCNSTLLITISNTTTHIDENLMFSVIGDALATVEVKTENETILSADTRQFREFVISVPEARQLRIRAESQACNGTQRATRLITVLPRIVKISELEKTPMLEVNETKTISVNTTIAAEPTPPEPTPEIAHQSTITGHATEVIIDKNTSAIPWIAAFGMVTLIVSAAVFFKIKE
jgi:hypothetical protein